jgi:simple sugar transport system ATP-binding protein
MTAPIYEIRGICKRFGAVQALIDLDFRIEEGEIIGLLGDNGAGKSTMIKLMSGIVEPDAGEIFSNGKRVQVKSRQDSERIGIETIYQDTAVVDSMSIVGNIFMGREITNRWGFLDTAKMRAIAKDVLKTTIHISGIDDPDEEVGKLSGGQKQAVAVARAVYYKSRILLLDEPTSALSVRETENLLAYIRRLKAEKVSSVLVTHNLYHAYMVCDRFVVMNHGRKVFEASKDETTIEELTKHVVLT